MKTGHKAIHPFAEGKMTSNVHVEINSRLFFLILNSFQEKLSYICIVLLGGCAVLKCPWDSFQFSENESQ